MKPITYHHENPMLAHGSFATALRDFSRELERDVPDASPQDRQFLQDIRRGEGRYKLVTLRRLAALSRRSTNVAHHEALAEIIRADTLAGEKPAASIAELFTEETLAQGECDLAQLEYARNPNSPCAIVRLRRAACRQLANTRRLLDRVAAL